MTLYHVTLGSRTYEVVLDGDRVLLDGTVVDAEILSSPHRSAHVLRVGRAHHRVTVDPAGGDSWTVRLGGRVMTADVVDERTRAIRQMTGSAGAASKAASIRAPMPGLVVKVELAVGDPVVRGRGVVIVEAMKMENELAAEADGRVARILVAAGDTVAKGQVLVELDLPEAAEGSG